MNKHHPHNLDSALWDREADPKFANLRLSLAYLTQGSAENPPKYVFPSEVEVMRILKENQAITLARTKKFLGNEITQLKILGLDTKSQIEYRLNRCIGNKPE